MECKLIILPGMTASLHRDLDKLSRLAFRRTEKAREVVREFHSVKKQIRNQADYAEDEHVDLAELWLEPQSSEGNFVRNAKRR